MREILLIFGEHLEPYASAFWECAFFLPFGSFLVFSEHECVFSCVCIIMDVYYV
jgi:hypothetical protein